MTSEFSPVVQSMSSVVSAEVVAADDELAAIESGDVLELSSHIRGCCATAG
jgi:hypothetical protein